MNNLNVFDVNIIKQYAQNNWVFILTRFGVNQEQLTDKHQPCPFCGGKDRYRFDNRDGHGTFYCNQCGSGDGLEFIKRLLKVNLNQAIHATADALNLSNQHTPNKPLLPNQEERQQQEAERKAEEKAKAEATLYQLNLEWNRRKPITPDCPVTSYLSNRGLPPNSWAGVENLHYLDDCSLSQEIRGIDCMVCKISNANHELIGLQHTFLQPAGNHFIKLQDHNGRPIENPRRNKGKIKGGSVKLFPLVGDTLVLAEGVESAIAAHIITGYPAWSLINAGNLINFEAPQGIQNIVIFADNDKPAKGKTEGIGEESARKLINKLNTQGINADYIISEVEGRDALDCLITGEF